MTFTLSRKEQSLFKQAVQFYENKSYKQGLQLIEQILTKQIHAESVAMKGLFLYHLDKQIEGTACVKQSLTLNIKSSICWHVFGLIHRNNLNYKEAIQCYKHALNIDKENKQILNECSTLMLFEEQFEQFNVFRIKLYKLAPSNINLMFVIYSYYCIGNYGKCISLLQSVDIAELTEIQQSHFYHFYADVCIKLGTLEQHKHILSRISDTLTRLTLTLDSTNKSSTLYELLQLNPYNLNTLKDYIKCASKHTPLSDIFTHLLDTYPNNINITLLHLSTLSNTEFTHNITVLLESKLKVFYLFTLLSTHLSTLQLTNTIPIVQSLSTLSPFHYLYSLIYTTHYYIYTRDYTNAYTTITLAIQHTPTLPDLYTLLSTLYTLTGCTTNASNTMNTARTLDLQDRYINTLTCTTLLHSNSITTAHSTLSLFLKDRYIFTELESMQCIWYYLHYSDALYRKECFTMSLDILITTSKFITEFSIDRLDFYGWCIRRYSVVSMHSMYTWSNRLCLTNEWSRLVERAVDCLFELHRECGLADALDGLSLSADDSKPVIDNGYNGYLVTVKGWFSGRFVGVVVNAKVGIWWLSQNRILLALRCWKRAIECDRVEASECGWVWKLWCGLVEYSGSECVWIKQTMERVGECGMESVGGVVKKIKRAQVSGGGLESVVDAFRGMKEWKRVEEGLRELKLWGLGEEEWERVKSVVRETFPKADWVC